jgi:type IV secretion system protein VirD4
MSVTKILWGQITVVLVIMLLTTWGATQWTVAAWLSAPARPALVRTGARCPHLSSSRLLLVVVRLRCLCAGIFRRRGMRRGVRRDHFYRGCIRDVRETETAATYGSARWAKQPDISAAGLAGSDGVMLGRIEGHYLRHNGPEHVLCFARPDPARASALLCPPS